MLPCKTGADNAHMFDKHSSGWGNGCRTGPIAWSSDARTVPSVAGVELVGWQRERLRHADLEITPDVREDHAAYQAHWLKVLKAR